MRKRDPEQTKAKLKETASKKFRTTMIFPLSQFESAFGELWGHGLDEDELTTQQKLNRKKWESVRSSILDNGNQQMRNFFAELDLHNVEYKGYTYKLIPVAKGKIR